MRLSKVFNDILMMGLPSSYNPEEDHASPSKIRSAFKKAVTFGKIAFSELNSKEGMTLVTGRDQFVRNPDLDRRPYAERVKSAYSEPKPR
jgi:hypothetical protein